MRVTCPSCSTDFPIEAGFADADGKRLAGLLAPLDAQLGRALVGYLRLWKPAKSQLRLARALRIASEVIELVQAGSVSKDERTGLRRPTTAATWAAGMEQMADATRLDLPLESHGYLKAVVFGLADDADAAREKARETALRSRNRVEPSGVSPAGQVVSASQAARDHLRHLHHLGRLTDEQLTQQLAELQEKSEVEPS